MAKDDHYLTLSCPDRTGIVHAVTGLLAKHDLTILDLQQFSDSDSNRFFMSVYTAPISQNKRHNHKDF
jgi:formyltetrahydrofolate deformylase